MAPTTERLQKILSQAGIASRRAAETLISEGRVRVNGKVVRELGARADPVADRVTVDGRAAVPQRLRYVAYNKPVGVVCSMSDPEGRPSIKEVARGLRASVFPVGRLDFDSSGLVLLTNDGDVAQRLSHPRHGVSKIYRIKVRGHPEEKNLDRIRRGIRLPDGVTAPAQVAVEARLQNKTRLRVRLHEGRQRQVRRMFEAIGHPVEKLSRVAIGPLRLGSLAMGATRELSDREVVALRAAVRMPPEEASPANLPDGPLRFRSEERRGRGNASASARTRRRPRR